ncbi:MAG TPA: type II toxin-antitoxin system VapC family toxin [Vicinamibacteria bacterium]|nr:type II toxin-antitoxin system VapC family toxin [Vicinamibacteria bacterium]
MIHLDTTFLVDLLRESARKKPGRASALLREIEEEEFAASVHVLCELHAGVELSKNPDEERERVELLCQGFTIVCPSTRFSLVYGELLASLERKGERIGVMDLLIATSAVIDKSALVTANLSEFRRVPGLSVIIHAV